MYIKRFAVENYKSFRETPDIELAPGFNVIVGRNNAGKTALAEALSLQFFTKPHRSLVTLPKRGTPVNQTSTARFDFALAPGEVHDLLTIAAAEGKAITAPFMPGRNPEEVAREFEASWDRDNVLHTAFQALQNNSSFDPQSFLESHGPILSNSCILYNLDYATQRLQYTGQVSGNSGTYGTVLANALRQRVYLFKAERLNVSTYAFGLDVQLRPDASNLPQVLHNLQNRNPKRFTRLTNLVSTIFPEIRAVTVPNAESSGNMVEILLWSVDPSSERDDLAIRLSESGTGIGQVLAMLYVTITSDHPEVIIIDEPQSFLNPGAVRKLIEILKSEFAQHQFIITTHSAEAIGAAEPGTLLLLRKDAAETKIETLDVTEAEHMQTVLSEVGVRLSDVFGADSIIWAEGPTEERALPIIAERVLKVPLRGAKILGVVQTGDFEGKHSERILQIYDRLTTGSGLVPPAHAFIFDREGRTDQQQQDLQRRSKGKVRFLPRRMYENYLLNPAAIAHVLDTQRADSVDPISGHKVEEWIGAHRWDRGYFEHEIREESRTPDLWQVEVHAAKLLQFLFADLGGPGVQYDKVKHGVMLTEWLGRVCSCVID